MRVCVYVCVFVYMRVRVCVFAQMCVSEYEFGYLLRECHCEVFSRATLALDIGIGLIPAQEWKNRTPNVTNGRLPNF